MHAEIPMLITCPKTSAYFHDKEEIDMHSNLVTESKVTECNSINLTIQTLQEEWTWLSQDYTRWLVQSMRQICLECVQERGRHTHYWKVMIVTFYFFLWHWFLRKNCKAHSVTFDLVTKLLCIGMSISLLKRLSLAFGHVTSKGYIAAYLCTKIIYFYGLNFYVCHLTEVASFFCCPVY